MLQSLRVLAITTERRGSGLLSSSSPGRGTEPWYQVTTRSSKCGLGTGCYASYYDGSRRDRASLRRRRLGGSRTLLAPPGRRQRRWGPAVHTGVRAVYRRLRRATL